MNCATHNDIAAVAFCRTCGKPLCGNCTRDVRGVIYCEACLAARLEGTAPPVPGFVPPGPRRQGFTFWAANECDHRHFRPTYFRDTDRPITEDRFEPEVWTDRAIEFLKQAGEAPFFLVVSVGPPHDPYGAPETFMKLYDPAKLTMRPNWAEGVPGAAGEASPAVHLASTFASFQ